MRSGTAPCFLDRYQVETGVEAAEIFGIGRDDPKAQSSSRDCYRGVDHVSGARDTAELTGGSGPPIVEGEHLAQR